MSPVFKLDNYFFEKQRAQSRVKVWRNQGRRAKLVKEGDKFAVYVSVDTVGLRTARTWRVDADVDQFGVKGKAIIKVKSAEPINAHQASNIVKDIKLPKSRGMEVKLVSVGRVKMNCKQRVPVRYNWRR